PRWREQSAEIDLVLIKAAYAVGEAGVDDARPKSIVRSVRYAAKYNSAIKIEADVILVGWADRSTGEYRYAAVTVATLGTIDLLVDYTVDAPVAAMHERHAVACRTSERNAHVVVTLVGELPEVSPSADFQRRREVSIVFAAITSKLQLAHDERRIADAKIET